MTKLSYEQKRETDLEVARRRKAKPKITREAQTKRHTFMNKRPISKVSDNGKFERFYNNIRRQGNPLKRRRLAKHVDECKSEF